MRLTRFPWREIWFLLGAFGLMVLWVTLTKASRAIPLALLGLLTLAVHLWLRRKAGQKLARESDSEFLEACQVLPGQEADAIRLRSGIAKAFGVPVEMVAARSRLCDLMVLTGWFGSDLLALAEVQAVFEKIAGRQTGVKPESSVLDLVRIVGAGDEAGGTSR